MSRLNLSQKISRIAAAVLALALSVGFFQNCAAKKQTSSSSQASLQGGDGYSGKPVFELKKETPCGDGKANSELVQLSQGSYALIRDNCATLSTPIPAPGVAPGTLSQYVIFRNTIFLSQALPSGPGEFKITCGEVTSANYNGQPATRYLMLDVKRYFDGTALRTVGLANVTYGFSTGQFLNLASVVDPLNEDSLSGVRAVGGVSFAQDSGILLQSSDASAFSSGAFPSQIAYTLTVVTGSSLTYAQQSFAGSLAANTGPINQSCWRF